MRQLSLILRRVRSFRRFVLRFLDYYRDPMFLPRSRGRAVLDVFPALWYAVFP